MPTILQGDALTILRTLDSASVNCAVTSPPYWGLRDYGVSGQMGLEKTPEEYIAGMVAVFSEVKRVLRDDGTLWVNIGDSYFGGGNGGGSFAKDGIRCAEEGTNKNVRPFWKKGREQIPSGYKPKDLVGIPWMLAFALRTDGWYLRQDIIWAKPNPMPESVTDRCTRSHEYLFMFSKRPRYYYDASAIREQPSPALIKQVEEGYNGSAIKDYLQANVQDASAVKSRIVSSARKRIDKQRGHGRRHAGFNERWDALTPAEQSLLGANKRSVWTISPACFADSHFATFPTRLISPCILAGCPVGGTVLDPFAGSGTTGQVALELGREAVLIELNPDYVKLIEQRCNVTKGLAL